MEREVGRNWTVEYQNLTVLKFYLALDHFVSTTVQTFPCVVQGLILSTVTWLYTNDLKAPCTCSLLLYTEICANHGPDRP